MVRKGEGALGSGGKCAGMLRTMTVLRPGGLIGWLTGGSCRGRAVRGVRVDGSRLAFEELRVSAWGLGSRA